jgi:uncharacterized protein YlxP (DUF503 family)
MEMFIRNITVEILIPESYSLKDKRQVLRSMIAKVRNRFNVAVIESGHQEDWQRAELGLAFLSNQYTQLDQMQQEIIDFIEANYPMEITGMSVNDY